MTSTITSTTRAGTAPGPIRRVIRAHPTVWFFVLACALSWWPALLYYWHRSGAPIASFGPFLAAIIVLACTDGRAGIVGLLRRMIKVRVRPLAYLAAIGLPIAISGGAVAANVALGAGTPTQAQLATAADIPGTLLLIVLIPGLGGAWEEPGFRGYALERLERRFGLITGPLVLGVAWVIWHLPLFIVGQILFPDIAVIIAASVVIAAVFHSARESVLIAMLLHATNNAVGGGFASGLFHGSDSTRLGILTAIGWWAVAIAIMVVRHRRRAER